MPTFATLQERPVVRAALSLPLRGAWTARLLVDTDKPLEGAVTLATNEGAVRFEGWVARGGVAHGRLEALLVGGRGGLARRLPARSYRSIPARLVLQALLSEAGESLASTSEAELLDQQLPHWTRLEAPTSVNLDRLCTALGARWRVDRAGQVLVTRATASPASASRGERLEDAPSESSRFYALELLDLEPGTTFDGLAVCAVEHEIAPSRIRTRVWA